LSEPKPLTLDRLSIVDLRNLAAVELAPARYLNVIAGNNGQGKTSILEAIYLLATSKSFRTAKLGELVRHGQPAAIARGKFREHWPTGGLDREQVTRLAATGRGAKTAPRELLLDGEAPASLAHYATRSPVVVFEPSQLALSSGPAAERRTLLDRLAMFAHPESGVHRARYARALKGRQLLLADKKSDRSGELDAFEALLAEHGAAVTRARRDAVAALANPLQAAFARIAAPDLRLAVRYAPGGGDDPAEARARLAVERRADAQRKRTGFGPHRDDFALELGGHEARIVGSQGQHRALTLALKSAELECIARARGVQPILLLDDVSSELDAERSAALFEHLAATESQIFLTTTRRELIAGRRAGTERADFIVDSGIIRPFSAS
jgi:DNA replication and repair protein RecF